MSAFNNFLTKLEDDERQVFENYIKVIKITVPESIEGLSYGMQAFKYSGRPLIGFGSNKFGLSIYPFDPRVIEDLATELKDFETTKGTIRFTVEKPLPDALIVLIVKTRQSYLERH